MTWRNKRDHINNYTCKWRNSDLGKTNPNHQYFMRLINKETADYLRENKDYFLANKPEVYYSMMNRKLPKKYIKEKTVVTPVNAYVPPQSKMSKEELNQILEKQLQDRRDKEQAIKIKKDKQKKEQERARYNRETFERERRYIYWVNPSRPINQNKLGSSQQWRIEKKHKYYD